MILPAAGFKELHDLATEKVRCARQVYEQTLVAAEQAADACTLACESVSVAGRREDFVEVISGRPSHMHIDLGNKSVDTGVSECPESQVEEQLWFQAMDMFVKHIDTWEAIKLKDDEWEQLQSGNGTVATAQSVARRETRATWKAARRMVLDMFEMNDNSLYKPEDLQLPTVGTRPFQSAPEPARSVAPDGSICAEVRLELAPGAYIRLNQSYWPRGVRLGVVWHAAKMQPDAPSLVVLLEAITAFTGADLPHWENPQIHSDLILTGSLLSPKNMNDVKWSEALRALFRDIRELHHPVALSTGPTAAEQLLQQFADGLHRLRRLPTCASPGLRNSDHFNFPSWQSKRVGAHFGSEVVAESGPASPLQNLQEVMAGLRAWDLCNVVLHNWSFATQWRV